MRSFFVRHYTIMLFVCLLLVSLAIEYIAPNAHHALMQPYMPTVSGQDKVGSSSGHATELVLDMSGSMSGNDPNKVRCSAADTYISLSHTGEYVGLVGLVNNNGKLDAAGFQTAEIWSSPLEMTYNNRQKLEQIIATKCNSANNTPTYDALDQAYQQLSGIIGQSGMRGSVLLLTDGEPAPATDTQITAIEQKLIPRFQQAHWPVDTVAIGTTETNFAFLLAVSTKTNGQYYNESQGKIATALNLMPLFVDIFQHEVGRTPGFALRETSLSGGTNTQEFRVNPYANSLDIIVVYDTPGTAVELQDPQGHNVPSVPIVSNATAPQYEQIFSIDHPVSTGSGSALVPWTLIVKGSGNYLMNTLLTSSLTMVIHTPTAAFLPLGKAFTVTTSVNNPDGSLYPGQFAVSGTLKYIGGADSNAEQPLTFSARNNQYQATVTVPLTAPSGEYQLDVSAAQTTRENQISTATLRFRLDNFPYPYFLSADGSLATGTAKTSVLMWPTWLQFYSLPVLQWPGRWALQGHPAQPDAELSGQLNTLDGSLYTQKATISAQVTPVGAKTPLSSQVIYDSNGRFHLTFPVSADGNYQVLFRTQGTQADSHGDTWTSTRMITLNIQNATTAQQLTAWLITFFCLICLLLYLCYVRFSLLAPPFGAWRLESSADGTAGRHRQFSSGRRNLMQSFLRRNELSSPQVGLNSGLRFRFNHHNIIMVKPVGETKRWLRSNGQALPAGYSVVSDVRYQAIATDANDGSSKAYHITPEISQNTRNQWSFLGIALGVLAVVIFLTGLLLRNPVLILSGLAVAPFAVAQGLPALLSTPVKRKPTYTSVASKRQRTNSSGRRGRR